MSRLVYKNLKYVLTQTRFKLLLIVSLLLNSVYIVLFNSMASEFGVGNGIDLSLFYNLSNFNFKMGINIMFFLVFIIMFAYYIADTSRKLRNFSFYESIRCSNNIVILSRIISIFIISIIITLVVYGFNLIGLTIYNDILGSEIANVSYSGELSNYGNNPLSSTLIYNSWIYPLLHISLFSLFIGAIGVLCDALGLVINRVFTVSVTIFAEVLGISFVLEMLEFELYSWLAFIFQTYNGINESIYNNYVTKFLLWAIVPFVLSLIIYYLVYKKELISEKS